MTYHLAQVNYARLLAPLDAPQLADFVGALDPVNAAADEAPGFVWRLATEDGDATAIRAFDWDAGDSVGVIVNMSVWTDMAALAAFVYGQMHREILRRRRDWFERMEQPTAVCWWIPAGHLPSTAEAEDRIRRLRADGPTPHAFTLRQHYPAPDGIAAATPVAGSPEWLCPA